MMLHPIEPLPLHHSWPLFDAAVQMDLGRLCDPEDLAFIPEASSSGRVGHWACDLRYDTLSWDGAVYDLLGFPRDAKVERSESLRVYSEESRVAMERLRAYAIRYRRGFTLDIMLRAPATARAMRLICAPICDDMRVTGLQGLKVALTN